MAFEVSMFFCFYSAGRFRNVENMEDERWVKVQPFHLSTAPNKKPGDRSPGFLNYIVLRLLHQHGFAHEAVLSGLHLEVIDSSAAEKHA
ncbi:MAG: hypothetical protein Q8J62_00830 [Candidatus Cloacimonadaceae bacterium]|nr:hypothetical protein [Candidatus Cloacimonadaceae bacterium]